MESESELLERIGKGDEDAFAEYLQAHRQGLSVYIDRNLGIALRKKVELDDILQETMIECLRSFREIDFSQRPVFSWICQVAQRRIIDAHRKYFGAQKRAAGREVPLAAGNASSHPAGFAQMLAASITSPSQAFSRDQKEFHLACAIDQLPADAQEVLRLRYVDGRHTKEIADKIGKSDAAVRVMLTRTVKKLQESLQLE